MDQSDQSDQELLVGASGRGGGQPGARLLLVVGEGKAVGSSLVATLGLWFVAAPRSQCGR
eukprot:4552875-Prorocentrum_lima.AAC.1